MMGGKGARAVVTEEGAPAILECLSDGVAMLDATEHSVVFANAALARMVGRSADELRALSSFFALVVPSAHPVANDRPRGVLAPRFELDLLHASGHAVSVEVATSAAGPGRVLAVVRDVSQRRRAEDALLKVSDALELGMRERADDLRRVNQTLEEALQMRDEFLSIASHELRTPITPLLLRLQLLTRVVARMAPGDEQREIASGIEAAMRHTGRLVRLAEQLLDVSRCEGNAKVIVREPVDLARVADAAVTRMKDEAARQGTTIRFTASGPVIGSWDAARIDQVIDNLLSNALKYGAGHPVDVAVEAAGDRARLVVRDRGIGIAAEDQPRIFERFERAVSARNYGGFGLGLWIAREAVEAHGGTIAVASAPGQGATFAIDLPR